ncbi:dihydrofolate reductase [Candidatus Saccharibacteria bacterium]|nr:dihydrofolate reductase [Candidatus Saccharibacteria bacterium]
MFSIIAAIGKKHELGKNGQLIFHIKEDMKFFREATADHKVVMGRKTWESLPGKLPKRENYVISRHKVEGADRTINDMQKFIDENKDTDEEIFIIGGGVIYAAFLPYAKTLYLTEINKTADADVFFPQFDKTKYEKEIIKKGKEDDLSYSFAKYTIK